ncbi:MAG TPA: protease modulator HflK, partial [Erythrobacter sp.]|nr:protease modulator HflK [Erythrobacter sp.]
MAGKKNPWGGGGNDGDPPEQGNGDSGPSDGGDSDGPRNPWLPSGGKGSSGDGRRSAN